MNFILSLQSICAVFIITTKEGHLFEPIVDAHLTTCLLCAYLKTVSLTEVGVHHLKGQNSLGWNLFFYYLVTLIMIPSLTYYLKFTSIIPGN